MDNFSIRILQNGAITHDDRNLNIQFFRRGFYCWKGFPGADADQYALCLQAPNHLNRVRGNLMPRILQGSINIKNDQAEYFQNGSLAYIKWITDQVIRGWQDSFQLKSH